MMKMNKKTFFLSGVLLGLFMTITPALCAIQAQTEEKPSKSSTIKMKSFSLDKEISRMNFNHVSSSDTSLGYLTTDAGVDAGSALSNPGAALSMASKGLKVASMLGIDFGLSSLIGGALDFASFLSGDSTSGCAVAEATRASLLVKELESNIEKITEYINLKGTTDDVKKSWGAENQNAVSKILSDAKGMANDYKDLVKFKNDPIGQQRVYGQPQTSLAAARQYVNNTFFYDAQTNRITESGKSPADLENEVIAARLAYLNEAIINSLGASYEYASIGVEESGKREKDLVERIVKAKNWDETRAAQALADLNVVRERIVNLSLQMRLLEQMAITNINATENAWVVPVSEEDLKERTRERMDK